jgi:Tfp pilus assembly protein PilF
MFTYFHHRLKSIFVLLCVLLVLVFVSFSASAQGGVGSTRGLPDSASGVHSISGRVYLPSGQRAGPGILVKLDGNVNGTRTAVTDGDGAFSFNGLPAADYQLTIDGGPEYELLKQTVVIYGTAAAGMTRSGQIIALDVQLLPKAAVIDDAKLFPDVPKAAVDSYKAAVKSAQAGNSKKAIEQLNAALAVYPTFTVALSELGVQYLRVGEMGKLGETMEALLRIHPKDARAHLNLGIALYNQKKFPDAETRLRQALELATTDPAAHYYLGMTLVSTKRYEEAEKELELAIKNGGENLALAHKYLGGLYMSSRKNQQAADELEKYLKLDPKAADAERIKGAIKDLRDKQ